MIGRILGYDLFDSRTQISVDRKLPQMTRICHCLLRVFLSSIPSSYFIGKCVRVDNYCDIYDPAIFAGLYYYVFDVL